jgi:hypothetical protein
MVWSCELKLLCAVAQLEPDPEIVAVVSWMVVSQNQPQVVDFRIPDIGPFEEAAKTAASAGSTGAGATVWA